MSCEIEQVINSERVLLSPPLRLGEFVTRHFYHAVSGFGTINTRYSHEISDKGVLQIAEANVTYHDFGKFEGHEAYWSINNNNDINAINNDVLDDEILAADIKEMIIYQFEDSDKDSNEREAKPQLPCTMYFTKREDNTLNMRHRLFNLRQPIDIEALQDALAEIKDGSSSITDIHIMPALSPTVLSVVISTKNPGDWVRKKRESVLSPDSKKTTALYELVTRALRRVVENSPSDPRFHIPSGT